MKGYRGWRGWIGGVQCQRKGWQIDQKVCISCQINRGIWWQIDCCMCRQLGWMRCQGVWWIEWCRWWGDTRLYWIKCCRGLLMIYINRDSQLTNTLHGISCIAIQLLLFIVIIMMLSTSHSTQIFSRNSRSCSISTNMLQIIVI